MLYRILAGAAVSVTLLSSAAAGQACQGSIPFRGSMHLGAGAGLTDHTTQLGGGIYAGHREGLFGGGTLGLIDYEAPLGSSFGFGGEVGYSMPLDRERKWEWCPVGTLNFGFGPDIGTVNVSTQTLTGGASFGTSLPLSSSVSLLPFGSVALGWTRLSGGGASATDTYFAFGFGAGFRITPNLVIQPNLGFLVATDNPDDTRFGVNVIWALPNGGGDSRPPRRR